MAFKDRLQAAIDERGGRTQENLYHIAELAREVAPDFTVAYLTRLLLGHPARPIDYQALAVALRVTPGFFIDDEVNVEEENRRKVEQFLSDRVELPHMTGRFIEHIATTVGLRERVFAIDDLYVLFNDYIELNHEEDNELT